MVSVPAVFWPQQAWAESLFGFRVFCHVAIIKPAPPPSHRLFDHLLRGCPGGPTWPPTGGQVDQNTARGGGILSHTHTSVTRPCSTPCPGLSELIVSIPHSTSKPAPPHNHPGRHKDNSDHSYVCMWNKRPLGGSPFGCWIIFPPKPQTRWSYGCVQGLTDYIDIKLHGLWQSDAFWLYITSPCVANSPAAVALTSAMA